MPSLPENKISIDGKVSFPDTKISAGGKINFVGPTVIPNYQFADDSNYEFANSNYEFAD